MPVFSHPLPRPLDQPARDFLARALETSFGGCIVSFTPETVHLSVDREVNPDTFSGVMRRLLYITKGMNIDVLHENHPERAWSGDPQPVLEGRGDALRMAPGMFLLQGDFLRVHRALDAVLLKIARGLGAVEQDGPALWPVDLFDAINYFQEFPQQVVLCAGVRPDFVSRDRFAAGRKRGASGVPLDDTLAEASYGLQPAVCDCCYYTLRGRRDMPDSVYTIANKVYRNEVSATGGLDRLTAFTVRDIMAVGSELFVLDMRQRLMDTAVALVQDLDLDCCIETASDPFFTNESAMKNVFQFASRLKYEILVPLPHSGTRMAVGSINLHLDFFGRAFAILLPDGSPAHSCCLGLGFERLAYALFCQYGPDLAAWPASLRERLGLG
ncbi:MAG: hypothetical protein AB1916_12380 [Thermodesulfobacteriota bacterium]